MKLHATGRDLLIKESERLISGSVNIYTCEFTFDESWNGYTVTAVFSTGNRLVNMAVVDGKCDIPTEVLRPNARIRIGVFGIDGVRSRPTTYSEWIPVEQGADVTGTSAQPPTPSVYEQWMKGIDEQQKEWNGYEEARAEAEAARVVAENARVEAEEERQALETGYVARAEAAAKEAEEWAKKAGEASGGDFATNTEAQEMADTAESNAKAYTDEQIAAIPTPDVSGQINTHNTDDTAHADIRSAIADAKTYTDEQIAAIPKPDVSAEIEAHNTSTAAHSDIRTELASKAPMYTYGTTDLEAGVTPLAAGMLHFVYEGSGGGSDVATISFTIINNGSLTGGTYIAEEGMTWVEWVSSGYNTIGAEIIGTLVVLYGGSRQLWISPDNGVDGTVVATNVIQTTGCSYYWVV